MPRKVMIRMSSGEAPLLTEVPAEDEAQLQEMVKANPDLLPIEDLEMTGPLMVIGRETTLPSGAVDLVALTRSGELLVIEFKTGPQNSDFRAALSQLVDYGSDLWGSGYDEFEQLVPLRYFASPKCAVDALKGCSSMRAAAQVVWPDMTDDEFTALRDSLGAQLSTGAMHYMLLAQRFTPPILRTIEYLNEVSRPRFYAVEVVRFSGDGLDAFESRVVRQPPRGGGPTASLTEADFLSQFEGAPHEQAVRELVQAAHALGYGIHWGTIGISIRVPVPDRAEPVSVVWVNPPGKVGWSGLSDVTFGYDPGTLENVPDGARAIRPYAERVGQLPGAARVTKGSLEAFRFAPEDLLRTSGQLIETLAGLMHAMERL